MFSAAGTLKTLIVRKLTAIVHGDAFECVIEVFSISAFQFVQSLYHAAACVVRQEDEDAVTAQPFGKDKERLGGALCAHHAVHLPISKSGALEDFIRAVFDAFTFWRSRGFFAALFGIVPFALFMQVLRSKFQKHIPTVNVVVKGAFTDIDHFIGGFCLHQRSTGRKVVFNDLLL